MIIQVLYVKAPVPMGCKV